MNTILATAAPTILLLNNHNNNRNNRGRKEEECHCTHCVEQREEPVYKGAEKIPSWAGGAVVLIALVALATLVISGHYQRNRDI